MTRVIYKWTDENGESRLAVMQPTDEALAEYGIDAICEKDIPHGVPYKIIEDSDLPEDRTFRDAWTVDDSILTDGVGGEFDMFITDPLHPNYVASEE